MNPRVDTHALRITFASATLSRAVGSGRNARIAVYLADDHPIYREGLAGAIKRRPDLELVGEAADGRAALEEIRDLKPDVAVLDLKMPELSGFEVLNALLRDGLETRVVVLSAASDSEAVFQAIAEGAVAYVPKEADRDRVCDAIAAAARGEVVLSSEIHAELASEIRNRGTPQRASLTPREQEVLRLTAEVLSAPEVGFKLSISAATVKTHMQSAYEKRLDLARDRRRRRLLQRDALACHRRSLAKLRPALADPARPGADRRRSGGERRARLADPGRLLRLADRDGRRRDVFMEVRDDGRGMTAELRRSALGAGHVGLASCTERVEAAGGELRIASAPREGTAIEITLPAPEKRSETPADGPETAPSRANQAGIRA